MQKYSQNSCLKSSDIEGVTGYPPALVGESVEWTSVVRTAEDNRSSYFKALILKTLFSALYSTCTVTLNESKAMLKASALDGQTKSSNAIGEQITQDRGFREIRTHKQCNSKGETQTSKKPAVQAKTSGTLNILPPRRLSPEMSSLPLRTTELDTDTSGT